MRTSNTRAKHFRSLVGTLVLALALTSVVGGISVTPAFGQERERREEHWRERHDERGRHWREWHGERGRRGYPLYAPPVYVAPPVYAPPPVVYPPPPSPGITLIFPLHIR